MARFYLDLHECGSVLQDADGIDAESLDAARALALTSARDVMCGEISQGSLCLSCFIEICDDSHAMLERVMFRDAVAISGL